ncbi:S1/P1 nuclease [Roseateles cellulosilyticus]|uniref:S1/P1 nuclease n=1 Tax=Pelomonas cellulosilytica TaxID=2906762 RepID=A0ABS8XMT8_9BURK|nr:S1/P1 nuclease [Pelomonas sp. P8]MCE4554089.1 S1/P1 nuclease [Pelomonas sp. P8]
MTFSRQRLRRTLIALSAATALATTPTAFAWSHLGHWLVGELAQPLLTPAAQQQVAQLLQGEPNPTLAGVASWADELRGSDAGLARKTAKWHYVDLDPERCDYQPPRDCPDGNCVIAAIDAQRQILADVAQPPEVRRDALKFLVHFIGDVHQPLHAGARHMAEGGDDAGGNKYQVSLRTAVAPPSYSAKRAAPGAPTPTNLHSVWDYYELESAILSPEKYANQLRQGGVAPISPEALGSPAVWAVESCKGIDAQGLYPRDEDGQWQHKLGGAYLDAKRPYAEAQIRTAAERLAAVLNQTLK